MSVVAVISLCIQKVFHSGIVKLFEGNSHQGIILHIVYFSLTDINIATVVISLSIHLFAFYTHT